MDEKKTKEPSGMELWAKREIELACKHEAPDIKDGEFDYGCACYESAYKAYKSLLDDDHSGASIAITKDILNRLIDCKPLTPIEDTGDLWNFIYEKEKNVKEFQCKRMSSLFKTIHTNDDGLELFSTYHDLDRCCAVDINNGACYHSNLTRRIIDEMFPISMPYMPTNKPYTVYTEDCIFNPNNEDFDTIAMLYTITPEGEKIEVNRYFKESEDGDEMVGIDASEYQERKNAAKNCEIPLNSRRITK